MGPACHEIHVLYGLGGGAFEEIVEGGDDDKALSVGGQVEADVAERGADGVLDLGQGRGTADPDGGAVAIKVVVEGLKVVGGGGFVEANVDRRENSAGNGQEVGGELDLIASEVKLFEELAGVPVVEHGVGGEIVGGVHEVSGRRGSLACAGDAGFRVGDDASV